MYNPSFAGLNENTSVMAGYQFYSVTEQQLFHNYYLTYDKYSYKWGGGLGFYFKQGLLGETNINTTEIGAAISSAYKINKGFFIPSLNLNAQFATKQWYVQLIDRMLDKQLAPPSPPGYDFSRYFKLKPRIGFLYDSPFFQAGFSAMIPFGSYITDEESAQNLNEPVFVLHLSQLSGGRKKGLVSKPFKTRPQLIVLYSKDLIMTRAELNVEKVYSSYSVFLQNNFSQNLHGIGGKYGWKFDNLKFNIAAGLSIPEISDEVTFFGELNMSVIIPPMFYNEKNPWVPKKKLF